MSELSDFQRSVQDLLEKFSGEEIVNLAKKFSKHPTWKKGYNVKLLREYPFVIKNGVERVTNANHLREIIQFHHLTSIRVPEKILCHIPGRPIEISDSNYLVIAEKIIPTTSQLNLVQIQELSYLMRLGIYWDIHPGNILIRGDYLYLIDTDRFAIPSPKMKTILLKMGSYPRIRKLCRNKYATQKAQEYLSRYILT